MKLDEVLDGVDNKEGLVRAIRMLRKQRNEWMFSYFELAKCSPGALTFEVEIQDGDVALAILLPSQGGDRDKRRGPSQT